MPGKGSADIPARKMARSRPAELSPVLDGVGARPGGRRIAESLRVGTLTSQRAAVFGRTARRGAGRLYHSARLTERPWRDATTVLLAAIIDDACARGFNEVDFLRGDEPYKGRFAPNHREM